MEYASTYIDLILISLLVIAVFQAFRLKRNITIISQRRDEIKSLLSEFMKIAKKLSINFRQSEEERQKNELSFQKKLDVSEDVADDLEFLITKGNKLLQLLDNKTREVSIPIPVARVKSNNIVDEDIRKYVARDIARKQVLKSVIGASVLHNLPNLPSLPKIKRSESEYISNQPLNKPDKMQNLQNDLEEEPTEDFRSQAEMELFEALKNH